MIENNQHCLWPTHPHAHMNIHISVSHTHTYIILTPTHKEIW